MAKPSRIAEKNQSFDLDNRSMLTVSFDKKELAIIIEKEGYYRDQRRPPLSSAKLYPTINNQSEEYALGCVDAGYWLFMLIDREYYSPNAGYVYFHGDEENIKLRIDEKGYKKNCDREFIKTISLPTLDVLELLKNEKLCYQVGNDLFNALIE